MIVNHCKASQTPGVTKKSLIDYLNATANVATAKEVILCNENVLVLVIEG